MGINVDRTARLVRQYIEDFGLDLGGLRVYTEAATGAFAVTAPVAAAAGAEHVYAIATDSSYGSADEAFSETKRVATALECADRLTFATEKRAEHLGSVDLLTNTGFVRPIDAGNINILKDTAVVSLMYEPWEFRESDLDIDACWNAGVPVVGTDESDGRVRTQEYVGLLPVKLSFEAGLEVMNTSYAVVGDGRMAEFAAEKLRALGADVTHISPSQRPPTDIASFDGIVVVEHRTRREIVGPDGTFDLDRLERVNPGVQILHICGGVDSEALDTSAVTCVPADPAPVGEMTVTAGYLGPQPVIALHTGSIAAGAVAARKRQAGESPSAAVEAAVETGLGADFSETFKRKRTAELDG